MVCVKRWRQMKVIKEIRHIFHGRAYTIKIGEVQNYNGELVRLTNTYVPTSQGVIKKHQLIEHDLHTDPSYEEPMLDWLCNSAAQWVTDKGISL